MVPSSTRTSIALALVLTLAAACKVSGSASLRLEGGDAEGEARGSASTDAGGDAVAIQITRDGDHLNYGDAEIEFETNSAELRGRTSAKILDEMAAVLRRYPALTVRVEGHTDSRGSRSANKDLSDRRARAIKAALVERGIDEARLTTTSHGEERPQQAEPAHCHNTAESKVAADKVDECRRVWAQNRRADFVVVEGAESLPAAGVVSEGPAPARTASAASPRRKYPDWALRLFAGYSTAIVDAVDHHGGHLGLGVFASQRFGRGGRGYLGGGPRLHYRGLRGREDQPGGEYAVSIHQLGPEGDLLIGGGSQRVVGLFSLRAGLGLSILRGSEEGGARSRDALRLGGWLLGGAVVLAKIAPRWSLGGHAEFGLLGIPRVGFAAEIGVNAAWHFGLGRRYRLTI